MAIGFGLYEFYLSGVSFVLVLYCWLLEVSVLGGEVGFPLMRFCYDMEVVLGRASVEERASGCIRIGSCSWRRELVLRSLVVLFLCRLLKRLYSVVEREREISVEGTGVFLFLEDCVEEMFSLCGRVMDYSGFFSVWLDRSVGGIMRKVCDIVDEYEMASDCYEIEVGVLRAVCSGLYWEFVSCYDLMSCELARDILECFGEYQ